MDQGVHVVYFPMITPLKVLVWIGKSIVVRVQVTNSIKVFHELESTIV